MAGKKKSNVCACGVDPAQFMDDPNWADFLSEVQQSGAKCHMPTHDDCTALDIEKVERHLQPGGTLGTMDGYEARPGQLEMVRAVTRAFNSREHLVVEAGTGVGKSLAYLVPSVQWSFVNDTPVILSTATRNLQSQLIASDLPRAAQTLGADAEKFRATLLKGRSNYLCLRMLAEYMQGGFWTLSEDEQAACIRLIDWVHATEDGDLDDFGDEQLRPKLSCPHEDCAGRMCPYHSKCFIAKARARALKAHVVVVNHALVLAEVTSGGANILPAFGRLVFDEAHNLEDIATNFFSFELSKMSLQQLLWRVARTTRSRHGVGRMRGVLGSIERMLQKGAFMNANEAEQVRELLGRAHVQISFVQSEGDALFNIIWRLFSPSPSADIIRYRNVASTDGKTMTRQYSLHGLFADYTSAQWDENDLIAYGTRLEDALARLQSILIDMAGVMQKADTGTYAGSIGEIIAQVQGIAEQFRLFILESRFVLKASDPARVYWAERHVGGKRFRQQEEIRLIAAPLSVAAEMKRYFYDTKDSVVLCSATLRAGDKFDYMARKLGVTLVEAGRVKTLVAASPFDYFRQVLALAPDFLPDPSSKPREYSAALAPFLRDLFIETKGRGLVLFTAYEMMRSVAEAVRPLFSECGLDLIVQGDGISRESMVTALKDAEAQGKRMVLFGAQSFWEGVDVPGAALSCVVLARLPFPQAGEPIVEARCDMITEEGGKSFRDFMVPEAQLRFRQGFGRLVRTKRDRGVVVVTDSRIVAKNYGVLFRKSVPASMHTVSSMDDLVNRIRNFDAP